MKKIKIVLMVVVVFIGFVVITHGQGSKVDEGVVEQITKTGGDIKSEVGKVKKPEKRIRIEQEGEGENAKRYLRIYDEKGRVKKEIKLGQEIKQIKAKSSKGKIKKDRKLFENIYAGVSDDGNIVAIAKSKMYLDENNSVLELELIDSNGEVKCQKEIMSNREPRSFGPDEAIKIYGDKIIIPTYLTGEGEDTPTDDKITIYDKNGNLIFQYPGENSEKISITDYKVSPNGKYIGINYYTVSGQYKLSVIFFNLSNGKSWDLEDDWGIKEIENNGKVHLYFQNNNKIIDLKSKIGD